MIPYISDSRFVVDEDGAVWTKTPHFAGDGWTRGLSGIEGLALSGRSRQALAASLGESYRRVDCERFIPIPDFNGASGLLRCAPRLLLLVTELVIKSDSLVCRVPGAVGVLALFVGRILRTPCACEVVGDVGSVNLIGGESAKRRTVSTVAKSITKLAVRQARAVRYMTRRTLQAEYPAGKNALTVGYSSVVLDDFWFDKRWSSFQRTQFVIVNIGSMDQDYKGQDLLLRAVKSLRALGVPARLVLVGDGQLRPTLERLAIELGVDDLVDFRGYESRRENLREVLLDASVFALPSRTEGLPRALLEAMAVGLPCVASSVGGCGELLPSEFLFPSENVEMLVERLRQFAANGSVGEAASAENRRVALEYSAESLEPTSQLWASWIANLSPIGR